MRLEDMVFILGVCVVAFFIATFIKFKEQGASFFVACTFSPTIPFIMLFALYVTFSRLWSVVVKDLSLKERGVCVFRIVRVMLSNIPLLHTVCVSFVCDILKENQHTTGQNNVLTGRLYADIENLVMA